MCSHLLSHNVLQYIEKANAWNVWHVLHTCSPSLDRKPLPLFAFSQSFTNLPSPVQSSFLHQQLKTSSKQCAGLRPTDIVMDLFCGTGSIGLTVAKDCRHVYGFESTASSVADARRNAEVNGISNATFVHGDLTKVAALMGKKYPSPDVIVTGGLFLRVPIDKFENACHLRGSSILLLVSDLVAVCMFLHRVNHPGTL